MAERSPEVSWLFLTATEADPLVYDAAVCLTTNGFAGTNSSIDASTFCGPKQLPGAQSINRTFTGQKTVDPDTGRISNYQLKQWFLNKTLLYYKSSVVAPVSGEDLIETGQGYLTSYNEDETVNNPGTFTGTLGVDGTPTEVVFP